MACRAAGAAVLRAALPEAAAACPSLRFSHLGRPCCCPWRRCLSSLASGRGCMCGDPLHVYGATPAASRADCLWAASPTPA
eukprot:6630786-Alexandrium_andersonii.AAC.1